MWKTIRLKTQVIYKYLVYRELVSSNKTAVLSQKLF